MLAETNDRRKVNVPLVPELRPDLRRRLIFGLRGDGPKERHLMFGNELQRLLGQGVALLHPVLPADPGLDPLG